MTVTALGHVMDIAPDRPATFITTPEDALRILWFNGNRRLAAQLMATVHTIRTEEPFLEPYLTHPSIITGLADGRCTPRALHRWLEELEIVDTGDDTADVDACFP